MISFLSFVISPEDVPSVTGSLPESSEEAVGSTSDIGDIGPEEMAPSFKPSEFSRIRSYRCLESAFTIAFIPSRLSPWDFSLGCSSCNDSNSVSPQEPRHNQKTYQVNDLDVPILPDSQTLSLCAVSKQP